MVRIKLHLNAKISKVAADISSPKRKCKRELIFQDDDDDDTLIAHLVRTASTAFTPKTSKSHETDSAKITVINQP